jgi:OOP family OmpA-OmpF porin
MQRNNLKKSAKSLLLISVISFTAACSNQSISIPGSQLFQQNEPDCVDKKTGKPIAGCKTENKPASKTTPAATPAESKRAPLILSADKPVATTETAPAAAKSADIDPNAKLVTQEPEPAVRTNAEPIEPVLDVAPTVTVIPAPAKVTTTSNVTLRRLTLSGGTTFQLNSSKLNKAGRDSLARLAGTLKAPDTTVTRILIEGHTDSSGNAAYNQSLSLKRANAVADYLAQQGIVRSSMETIGRGESQPIADNKTKAGRAQNRRVEITASGTRQSTR